MGERIETDDQLEVWVAAERQRHQPTDDPEVCSCGWSGAGWDIPQSEHAATAVVSRLADVLVAGGSTNDGQETLAETLEAYEAMIGRLHIWSDGLRNGLKAIVLGCERPREVALATLELDGPEYQLTEIVEADGVVPNELDRRRARTGNPRFTL